MIIGVDIDNVLVTTTEAVLEYINERLGTNFVIGDVKEYYIENLLQEQYRWIVPLAFKDSDMWRRVKPIDGALETVEKLIADGHEIYFCTSTYPENVRKKIKHIVRNSNLTMKFVSERMINIHKKQLLNLDFLVDDCSTNLIGSRNYFSICFDYPWNRDVVQEPYFYRAKDWKIVYRLICELSKI